MGLPIYNSANGIRLLNNLDSMTSLTSFQEADWIKFSEKLNNGRTGLLTALTVLVRIQSCL